MIAETRSYIFRRRYRGPRRSSTSSLLKLSIMCSCGNRSSRPKVMLPEVMLPETGVMLPEIHCHVARNPESYRPKFYRVYKLEKKKQLM